MIGRYVITNHALQRYEQRTNKSKQNTKHRMLRDLHATRNKKMVYIGSTVHTFYRQPNNNVREFVMEKKNNVYVVTTVINRNAEDSELAYKNRLHQKKVYEEKLKEDKK